MNELDQFYFMQGDMLRVSATPVPLQFTPDGWQDISILTEKNKAFFGLDRTYGAPQSFVEDGANILKGVFYNQGVEGKVYLLVLEEVLFFDATYYGFYYRKLVKAEVDLSNYDHAGEKVTANILEGDLIKYFKANLNTVYELPLTDNPIVLTGMNLHKISHYSIINGLELNFADTGHGNLQIVNIPISISASEGESSGLTFTEQALDSSITTHFAVTSASNTGPVLVRLVGELKFTCGANSRGNAQIRFVKSTDNSFVTTTGTLIYNATPAVGPIITVPFDVTLSMLPDETWIFDTECTGVGPFNITFLPDSKFDASFSNSYKTTFPLSIKPMEALTQFVSLMSGGRYTAVQSTLFSSDQTVVITSGDGIRSLPKAVVKSSFNDWFASYNLAYNIGVQIINNVLIVEKKEYFMNSTAVTDLGEVSSLKVLPASDYFFNTVQVGYPNQDYNQALGDVNGKYEFNVTQSYSAPITRYTNTLSLVSKYRADCYGIAFTQLNLDGKVTTDSSSDNDVFMIKVLPTLFPNGYLLDQTLNSSASGLIEIDTIFNLWLSPKSCLLRHGNYLRIPLDKREGLKLVYNTADKSPGLVIGTIAENADVMISDLAAPMAKPYLYEFTTRVPNSYMDDMETNPNRVFTFTYKNQTISLSGYAQKVGIQPADDKQQAFTLLAGPNDDLTQLINVYE